MANFWPDPGIKPDPVNTRTAKILLLPPGEHGGDVMLVRQDYVNIYRSHFYQLGNSLKTSYLSFR